MPENSAFFRDQTDQSAVKAKIVSSYFTAWSRVIKKWNCRMGYIDLFSGPGRYGDNNLSAPLLIIQSTLSDPVLTEKMMFLFNDNDCQNIEFLKQEISRLDIEGRLKHIDYWTKTIDLDTCKRLIISKNIPILSFVDPFGYKGLTKDLINLLIANGGSDCVFFFNYNRINMALSQNTKFDEHLIGLFGEERMRLLKNQLSDLSASQREPIVINALIEALREKKDNYVLPFRFNSVDMLRTSHYIVFITKNRVACKIMKQIMYSNSAKDKDGVATFSFDGNREYNAIYTQLSMFDGPIMTLEKEIKCRLYGKQIAVGDLCNEYDQSFTNQFVGKNVKDVLRKLELEGSLVVISGRKASTRNGIPNMPDKAIVSVR